MSLHQKRTFSNLQVQHILKQLYGEVLTTRTAIVVPLTHVPQGPKWRESKTLTIIIMRANSVGNIKYVLWGNLQRKS